MLLLDSNAEETMRVREGHMQMKVPEVPTTSNFSQIHQTQFKATVIAFPNLQWKQARENGASRVLVLLIH